jgi:hypothetical protein
MTRRTAVTLLEALMAIFVMAIGLLSLLTLFPLGAVQMGQALKDQRTAEASINATAQFNAFGIGSDTTGVVLSVGNATLFENPWPAATAAPGVPSLVGAGSTYVGPSYPIFVDPLGIFLGGVVTSASAGSAPAGVLPKAWPTMGGAGLGIPRATVGVSPPSGSAQRWFVLQDDITFGKNGVPDASAGFLQREGRYSFAYMLRRLTSDGTPQKPELTVVVYAGRAPGANAGGFPLGETVYGDPNSPTLTTGTSTGTVTWGATAAGVTDANVVTINWAAPGLSKPALRRGSWILDARMVGADGKPAPQGYFYRVVSVTDVGANLMEVEVQRPLGGQLRSPIGPNATGPLVVMEHVAEVFEKGTNY